MLAYSPATATAILLRWSRVGILILLLIPAGRSYGFTQVLPPFTSAADFITGFSTCSPGVGPIGVLFDGTNFFVTHFCDATLYRFGPAGGDISVPDAQAANGLDHALGLTGGIYYGVANVDKSLRTFDPGTLATSVVATFSTSYVRDIVGDPLTDDVYVATSSGIFQVENPLSVSPVVTTFANGDFDGIAFTSDGQTLYAAFTGSSTVVGLDRSGSQVFNVSVAPHLGDGIAVAEDNTSIQGTDVSNNLFVNCLDGVIVRIDVNNGNAVSVVASGGTRGDLVTVGPDKCLYATQTDRVIKLSPCFFQPTNPDPCGNGTVDPGEECDDGTGNDNDCCTNTCEIPVCREGQKSILIVKDKTDDDKDKLVLKLLKGDQSSGDDFADPTQTATYHLCLYAGTAASLVTREAAVPPGGGKWKAKGGNGYKYKDKLAAADGIKVIVAKSGDMGKTKVIVKGKGAALPELTPPLEYPVKAIVMNSDTGVCYEGNWGPEDEKKNKSGLFKAKDQQ